MRLVLILLAGFYVGLPFQSRAAETVFLVNGWLGEPHAFFFLQQRLEKAGYRYVTAELRPSNGTVSLVELSDQLSETVPRECDDKPFSLVGFSMGGVVARQYLAHGGAAGCRTFISISAPQEGSWLAHLSRLAPLQAIEEMQAGSGFLEKLADRDSALSGVRCFDYQTPLDWIVAPSSFRRWSAATGRRFAVPAHYLMVADPAVQEQVLADLAGMKVERRKARGRPWLGRR